MNFKRLTAAALGSLTSASMLAACGSLGNRLASPAAAANAAAMAANSNTGDLSLIVLPDMGGGQLLQALGAAKKSIKLEMYMLTNSKFAAQVVSTLIERKKAGVNVQVMLETQPYMPAQPPKCQVGTFNPNTPAINALVAGGVTVKYTNPRFKYTHAKSLVIDGEIAFIMSANMTNAAYTINRDYLVMDRNKADVAEVGKIFDSDWVGQYYVPKSPNLVVSPTNSRAKLLQLIDSAQKSLVIQTEFFSDPEVGQHLAARVKAGVDITVMLSFQGPDKCSGGSINDDEQKQLAAVGVTKVAFIKSVVMHAKTIIVDGKRAFIGSENLSANSLDNNREIGVLFEDPTVIGTLQAVTQKDWASRGATSGGGTGGDQDALELF